MKSADARTLLRWPLYLRGCVALFLAAIGPRFPAAHAENFKFESKPVLSRYTATIGGELSFPAGAGPFPVVILLHACGGLDQWAKASLSAHARSLIKAGFATYLLDSFSARGLTASDVCDGPKGREASEFRLDDLFNARDALQKLPKVDKTKFFVVGQSHGATVALWSAMNTSFREPFRAVAAFYPDCRAVRHSLKLKSAIIIFAAEKDDWTPAPLCEEATKKERAPGEGIELIIYPGAHHAFDQQRPMVKYKGHTMAYDEHASADSRKRMQEFFVRHLRDEPPGASSSPKSESN